MEKLIIVPRNMPDGLKGHRDRQIMEHWNLCGGDCANVRRMDEKGVFRSIFQTMRCIMDNVPSECPVRWHMPGQSSASRGCHVEWHMPRVLFTFNKEGGWSEVPQHGNVEVSRLLDDVWAFVERIPDEEQDELLGCQ